MGCNNHSSLCSCEIGCSRGDTCCPDYKEMCVHGVQQKRSASCEKLTDSLDEAGSVVGAIFLVLSPLSVGLSVYAWYHSRKLWIQLLEGDLLVVNPHGRSVDAEVAPSVSFDDFARSHARAIGSKSAAPGGRSRGMLREQYPYLWLYEAQMLGIGAEQAGQVDLVFGSEAPGGMVRLAVVEAKSLGLDVKGRTARTRRTFKRQKVSQQAISGIRHVIGPGVLDVVQKLDLDIRVTAFTWTEEGLTNVMFSYYHMQWTADGFLTDGFLTGYCSQAGEKCLPELKLSKSQEEGGMSCAACGRMLQFVRDPVRSAAMPQQSEAKRLHKLTEVPAGWSLATIIDAFTELAGCPGQRLNPDRAREAVSLQLVELWASQPAEAEAWLQQCRERFTTALAGKATRPEELQEALHRHGAAECGKYGCNWRFSEAGLVRGAQSGSAADQEREAAWYLLLPHIRDRCRELAERLAAAESPETARKRQKLEEESSERRRLEAELEKSQEEGRELSNRLAAAEAEVSSKAAELQAAQSEIAKCKELCEELTTRAAAAESAAAEMQKELGQLQGEHGKCQGRCEELVARLEAEASKHAATKERLSQAESDAAERKVELHRLQEESRGYQAEAGFLADETGSKAELLLQKAVFQDRCDQLRQMLSKAEAERSVMLGQMQVLWEENGMYKERARELEKQLLEVKESHHHSSGHDAFGEAPGNEVSDGQQPDLAEQLGYSFVDDDGTSSSVLSRSSWFSVKPDSVKPHCFMVDAIFKTRSYGADFFLMGRDLKKGSQVVAGDDTSILEVAKTPEICDASEVVELQAGAATLRVTPDHLVRVADPKGEAEESLYLAAGQLKAGDLVMLDSGEVAALSSIVLRREACQVLKIVFEPYMPVAVFSRPTCILSLGHKKKRPIRRGGRSREGPSDDSTDGGVSVPITAGEYMD
ncbi:unnamed protein product [Symbiodinium microadriaticum]|nr:unnamed protein product [Symbiodinium microadriaticum]